MKVVIVGKKVEDGGISTDFLSDEEGKLITFTDENDALFYLMVAEFSEAEIMELNFYQVEEEDLKEK